MGCSPLADSRFRMGVIVMGFAEHFGYCLVKWIVVRYTVVFWIEVSWAPKNPIKATNCFVFFRMQSKPDQGHYNGFNPKLAETFRVSFSFFAQLIHYCGSPILLFTFLQEQIISQCAWYFISTINWKMGL